MRRQGPPILIGAYRRPDGEVVRDRLGTPRTFHEPIRDAESWAMSLVETCLRTLGMYVEPAEKVEFIGDTIELLYKLEKKYDPEKNPSFTGYAAWIVPRRLIDIIPRSLLGRNGGRIAQRSHEELTDRVGDRHQAAHAAREGDPSGDPGTDRRWLQRNRDRQEAWSHAILGIRAA